MSIDETEKAVWEDGCKYYVNTIQRKCKDILITRNYIITSQNSYIIFSNKKTNN